MNLTGPAQRCASVAALLEEQRAAYAYLAQTDVDNLFPRTGLSHRAVTTLEPIESAADMLRSTCPPCWDTGTDWCTHEYHDGRRVTVFDVLHRERWWNGSEQARRWGDDEIEQLMPSVVAVELHRVAMAGSCIEQ